MQTKQQLQQHLAIAGARPNKKLGQNFLIDLNLIRLFLKKADIQQNDIVLEVGPGTGSLTEEIAQRAGKVIAVEFDKRLAKITAKNLKKFNNTTVINADILENQNHINSQTLELIVQARKEFDGRFVLVANLPYDISSALMANLLMGPVTADEMFVTVQKEVGLRMVAKSNDNLYGTLGILMAALGEAEIFHKLGKKVFWPAPKVDSVMVHFKRLEEKTQKITNIKTFRSLVAMFMQHRRKMLKACTKFAPNELSEIENWEEIFTKAQIDSSKRPENIAPKKYVELANTIEISKNI